MRLFSCLLFSVAVSTAAGVPYNGLGPNFSIIDSTGAGDYLSLTAALASARNGTPLTGGDWTFRIRTNLTESSNIAFGKLNSNGNRIIVRPDNGTSVTVKFTSTSGRAHIAIGTNDPAVDGNTAFIKTDNFVIDGSNNGTNSRNLTLTTDPVLQTALTVIQVAGNSDGCQVKNCTILSPIINPNMSSNYPLAAGVQFASYYSASMGLTNEYPDNGLVENNHIVFGSFKMAVGVMTTQKQIAGSAELPGGQTGIIIRNNTITACRSAIELQSSSGAQVYANTITVDQPSDITDGLAVGILAGKAGSTSSDVNIYNNRILSVHGKRGYFTAVSGITVGSNATGFSYNIYNNMICDVQVAFHNVENVAGIQVAGTGPTAQYANIYHNSIHMTPPPSERTFGSGSQAPCISIPGPLQFGRTSHVVVKNNIFVNEETTGVTIARNAPGSLVSDHNAYYFRTGSPADLTSWQSQSGQDLNSTYANPRVANPPASGLWTSLTDLHFTAYPGSLFQGTALPSVPLDIDSQLRHASTPTKGADESAGVTRVDAWAYYD